MWEIYTFGGLEDLRQVFNAVNAIMGEDSFTTLIRLIVLMGIVVALFQAIFSQKFHTPFVYFMFFVLVYMGLFVPKVTVRIIDRMNITAAPVEVANTPLGLALIASLSSTIGDLLTRRFEFTFALPDELQYQQNGMTFGSRLVEQLNTVKIPDARFESNMIRYLQDCVFYDVYTGNTNWDRIIHSADLWSLYNSLANNAYMTTYENQNGNREIVGCLEAHNRLGNDWTTVSTQISARLAMQQRGLDPATNPQATAAAISQQDIDAAYQYYTSLGLASERLLQQYVQMNLVSKAAISASTNVQNTSKVLELAYGQAEANRNNTNITASALIAKSLPMMKNSFEAILYGIFPVILLAMLLPGGGQAIGAYVKGVVWLQLWPILFAIVNLLVQIHARNFTDSYLYDPQSNAVVLNMLTTGGMAYYHGSMVTIAGYVMTMVPLLAWYLVSRGQYAIAQAASALAAPSMSSASSSSSMITTGNYSVGNTSVDTSRSGKHDWMYQQTNYGVKTQQPSGMLITQYPGGGPDGGGRTVFDASAATTRGNLSIDYAKSLNLAYQKALGKSEALVENEQKEYAQSTQLAENSVIQLGEHLSSRLEKGDRTMTSNQYQYAEAYQHAKTVKDELGGSTKVNMHLLQSWMLAGDVRLNGELALDKFLKPKGTGGTFYQGLDDAQKGKYDRFIDALSIKFGMGGSSDWSETEKEGFLRDLAKVYNYMQTHGIRDDYSHTRAAMREENANESNGLTRQLVENEASQLTYMQQASERLSAAYQQREEVNARYSEMRQDGLRVLGNFNNDIKTIVDNDPEFQAYIKRTGRELKNMLITPTPEDQAQLNAAAARYFAPMMMGEARDELRHKYDTDKPLDDLSGEAQARMAEIPGAGELEAQHQARRTTLRNQAHASGVPTARTVEMQAQSVKEKGKIHEDHVTGTLAGARALVTKPELKEMLDRSRFASEHLEYLSETFNIRLYKLREYNDGISPATQLWNTIKGWFSQADEAGNAGPTRADVNSALDRLTEGDPQVGQHLRDLVEGRISRDEFAAAMNNLAAERMKLAKNGE